MSSPRLLSNLRSGVILLSEVPPRKAAVTVVSLKERLKSVSDAVWTVSISPPSQGGALGSKLECHAVFLKAPLRTARVRPRAR